MSAPLILGTNSIKDVGYEVDNSLRFNSGSSDYLNKTFSSSGNRKTFTFSTWIKISKDSGDRELFGKADGTDAGSNEFFLLGDGRLGFGRWNDYTLRTKRKLRDYGAWYHIVLRIDSTLSTADDRARIYINGIQETDFEARNNMVQNYDHALNANVNHLIGAIDYSGVDQRFFGGYMAEVCFIDGQSLDATSFGEFDEDTGIWKPIDVSGLTFGTNGFYLDFEDSSALGNDVSGNDNDFTVNNLTSIDQSTDTCTNNWNTLNNLTNTNSSYTFSDGNLTVNSSTNWLGSASTIAVSKGKWYCELKYLSGNFAFGIGTYDGNSLATKNLSTANSGYIGKYTDGHVYYKNGSNSQKLNNDSVTSYGSTPSANDILMLAFDADNGTIWVGKNGTWFGSATQSEIEAGTTTNSMFTGITVNSGTAIGVGNENGSVSLNFGNPPFSITSGNSDGNGYGNFEYSVPSGYYALNTKNLAEYG